MLKNWRSWFTRMPQKTPWTKKIIGVFLILIGLFALVTPFTPGAVWLIVAGFAYIGIHVALWDDIKNKFKKKP